MINKHALSSYSWKDYIYLLVETDSISFLQSIDPLIKKAGEFVTKVLQVKEKKKKMGSIPGVFFIKFVHESLNKGQSLTGAEQQVAFHFTLQVDPIISLLLKINVFDIEGLAPFGVIMLVIC